MYREVLEKLVNWKEQTENKLLLLAGAKGVGKSYILKDFGEGCFDGTVIVELKSQEYVRRFFEEIPNRNKLCSILELSGGSMPVPGHTLIIIENIDCVKDIARVVEFLTESMSDYHIALTSSVVESFILDKLGDNIKKLEIITLYPLTFKEFLNILNEEELCGKIEKKAISDVDKKQLSEYIRKYIYIGGMPSVVQKYLDTGDIEQVKREKQKVLETFMNEFEKVESKPLRDKVKQVWKSIPAQLEKENKKFQFGVVKLTARAREYKEAVEWLYKNKYITLMNRLKEPKIPFSDYIDEKSYEVFVCDVGILVEMYGISYEEIADVKSVELLKAGAIAEQYVYAELNANENVERLCYWISEATARISFLFDDGNEVIPVEVNLCENAKAQSIKVFRARYETDVYISITNDVMKMEEGVLKLPLYAIWNL